MPYKASLLVCLVLSVSANATAQFALDLSGGVNRSWAPIDVPDGNQSGSSLDFEGRTAFFVGVTPSYAFSEHFRALLTVQYSAKGYAFPALLPDSKTNVRLGYVDLMPEVEWRPIERFGLSIGPYFGLNVGEQAGELQTNDFDLVRTVDVGAVGAARVYCGDFYALLRYGHGFTNISNIPFTDENGQLIDPLRQRIRNVQVGAGYRFGFRQN